MKINQREFLSSKLGDLGNLSMAALVFGQYLSQGQFEFSGFLFGIFFWTFCYLAGYLFLKGGE